MTSKVELSADAKGGLMHLIMSTLNFDAGRTPHTVESLIMQLKHMGVLRTNPDGLDINTRIAVSELMLSGKLDMRSDGVLIIPETTPELDIVRFCGRWFTVTDGHIGGPFKTEGEAISDVLNFSRV